MKKKLLAILLTVCMVLSMAPAALAASTAECSGECAHEAAIGSTHYDTLAEAVSSAESNDTITLLKGVTLERTVTISNGDKVTLDLNGKTIDFNPDVWIYGAANSGTALITVCFGGDLTIEDSSADGTGTIDGSANVNDVYGAVMMTAAGDDASNGTAKLTVNGGTLIGGYAAIAGNRNRDNTEITINGGTIKANISDSYSSAGIEHPMNGKLTIKDGTIQGMDGISLRSGTLVITGGTIIGNAPETAFEDDGYWDNNFGACTGHALQIVNRQNNEPTNETPTVTITGGTFVSANTGAVGSYASSKGENPDTQLVGFISGGTFSSDPTAYLAAGYKATEGENGWVIEENFEAKIGETKYVTLAEAVSEATSSQPIILLKDITLTETVCISSGTKVTLDLNGKTIDFNPDVWVYGAANSGTALLTVCFGGDLTIEDSSTDGTGTIDGSANVSDVYGAVMMTAKGDDAANGTAKLTVNGGTLIGGYAAIAGNKDRDNTEITINGGTIKANISDSYSSAGIEHPMNGNLTVAGGTIQGMDGISLRSGTLVITGGTVIGNAPESAFEDDGYWDNDFGTCTGHALQIVNRQNSNPANETPNVSITGGSFASVNTDAVGSYAGYKGETPDTQITGFITGGYFTSNPSAYLADGYIAGSSDKSGYPYKVVEGTIVEGVEASTAAPSVTVPESAEIKQEHVQEVTEAAAGITVSGLDSIANELAADVTTEAAEAAADALENSDDVVVGDEDTVTVHLQTYLDIEPTAYTPAEEGTEASLTVDITPMSRLVASTEEDAEDIILPEDEGTTNAVVVPGSEQEVEVTETVTLTVPLPAGFANVGDTLYITHTKDDGSEYVYEGIVSQVIGGQLYVTFENPHGFSIFTITTKDPSAAKIGDIGYTSFAAAVNAVENGSIINVVNDCTEEAAAVVSKDISFTVLAAEGIGYNLEAGNNTTMTSTDVEGGKTYTFDYTAPYIPPVAPPSNPSYRVTVEETVNGNVTVSTSYATAGQTVTITVNPDKGYVLETLTVLAQNGKEIELTKVSDNQHSFKMPSSKATVYATFMEDNTMLNYFVDVFASDYYYDAVLWAVENDITNGTSDTTFSPNAVCTRAQVVTFLWRAAGEPAPKSAEMPFSDVAKGAYYYDAVLWAVENGITNGTSATTFSPDADCTRGQIVTFLWRSQGSENATANNPFVDVADGAYYEDAVLWAVEEAITNGTGADTFSPDADCTRGQIVTFLYRCLAE